MVNEVHDLHAPIFSEPTARYRISEAACTRLVLRFVFSSAPGPSLYHSIVIHVANMEGWILQRTTSYSELKYYIQLIRNMWSYENTYWVECTDKLLPSSWPDSGSRSTMKSIISITNQYMKRKLTCSSLRWSHRCRCIHRATWSSGPGCHFHPFVIVRCAHSM